MMQNELGVLDRIGPLLVYPRGDFGERVECCRAVLPIGDDEADPLLDGFVRQIQSLSLEKVQELYTHTFDLNPVCALEVGWQLHGEDYSRGEFLVDMRKKLRFYRIPESRELPDHLSCVLSLLNRLDPEEARNFQEVSLRPALKKMLAGFSDESNPYRNLLLAIAKLLSHDSVRALVEAPRV